MRGGGQEQLATGVNPAFNRERFEEAHELIVRAWTQPGPFRWEGTHYQHRVVNPWAVPLQKPHPRVWIPGVLSKETIIWAASQRYPYIALSTAIDATKKIWELYDSVAAEAGYTRRPGEPRVPAALPRGRDRGEGPRQRPAVHVDAGRVHRPRAPGVVEPVGLLLAVEPQGLRGVRGGPARQSPRGHPSRISSGTSRSSRARRRRCSPSSAGSSRRRARPSSGSGRATASCRNEDTTTCIRLLGQEVLPAVREMGKELGLLSPFEADAPVSIKYPDRAGRVAEPAVAAAAG